MLISTKGRYALRVIIDIASHDSDEFIPLGEVAERQGISKKYLEAIIKDLVQAGIVKGVRGKGGGYKLNMKPEECTAWDVIHATEDNFVTVSCVTMEKFDCPQKSECRTMPMWTELDKTLKEFFSKYTIKELLESGSY